MKIAKFFAAIFAALGCVCMIATIGLSFWAQSGGTLEQALPPEADQCAQQLMDALTTGDYSAASGLIYGKPDLGLGAAPQDPVGQQVWEGFLGSLTYEFAGGCYVENGSIWRDVTVHGLDVSAVTAAVSLRAEALLEDVALPEEAEGYTAQQVEEVLAAAAAETLSQAEITAHTGKIQLLWRENRWWAIPDAALITAVSGGLA